MMRRRALSPVLFVLVVTAGLAVSPKIEAREVLVESKMLLSARALPRLQRLLGAEKLQHRQLDVYYFDTPERDCYASGLVLRLRHYQGKGGERWFRTTVKVRSVGEEDVKSWDGVKGFKYEVDRTGDRREQGAASVSADWKDGGTREVLSGKQPLSGLLSAAQKQAVHELAGRKVEWSKLEPNGPVPAEVWRWKEPRVVSTPVTLEKWRIGGRVLLELSVRDTPRRVAVHEQRIREWLQENGIEPEEAPALKTKAVLDHFAGRE